MENDGSSLENHVVAAGSGQSVRSVGASRIILLRIAVHSAISGPQYRQGPQRAGQYEIQQFLVA